MWTCGFSTSSPEAYFLVWTAQVHGNGHVDRHQLDNRLAGHVPGRPYGYVDRTERHVLRVFRFLFPGHAVRRQPRAGDEKSISGRNPIEPRKELDRPVARSDHAWSLALCREAATIDGGLHSENLKNTSFDRWKRGIFYFLFGWFQKC